MGTVKDRNGKEMVIEAKGKKKGKDISKWMQSSRIAKRDEKTFLSEQCKQIEKTIESET